MRIYYNGGFQNDKYIFDESNGLWYELRGDYYFPCLILPAEEETPIGVWGQRHLRYIKEHLKALYTSLQVSGKLNSYLADIDHQAKAMFSRLVTEMAQRQDITEQLKTSDQMTWIGRMNSCKVAAEEMIFAELIYS